MRRGTIGTNHSDFRGSLFFWWVLVLESAVPRSKRAKLGRLNKVLISGQTDCRMVLLGKNEGTTMKALNLYFFLFWSFIIKNQMEATATGQIIDQHFLISHRTFLC